MSEPKRHHYVPQFYLRRFSNDDSSICCLNKSRVRTFEHASIKGQCAIPNFHGWHKDIEKALGYLEGRSASIVKKICRESTLDLARADYIQLLLFTALQLGRTKLSADSNDKMTDIFAKLVMEGNPKLAGVNFDNFVVKNTYPVAQPLAVSAETFGILDSLSSCLLVLGGKYEFLTSDNPVLLYNSAKSHVDFTGVIGLDSSGLQVIFPLDSKHALYLYDPSIYRNPTNTNVRKISTLDAIKINLIQYLWSANNVYFKSFELSDQFMTIARSLKPYTGWERVGYNRTQPINTEDDKMSELIHTYRTHVPIELDFSFSRTRKIESGAKRPRWRSGDRDTSQDNESEFRRYELRDDFKRDPRKHLKDAELGRLLRDLQKPYSSKGLR